MRNVAKTQGSEKVFEKTDRKLHHTTKQTIYESLYPNNTRCQKQNNMSGTNSSTNSDKNDRNGKFAAVDTTKTAAAAALSLNDDTNTSIDVEEDYPDSDQFRIVKDYLLKFPYVKTTTSNGNIIDKDNGNNINPAIKAALDGLDKEIAKRQRDVRLRRKFAAATTTTTTSSKNKSSSGSTLQNSLMEDSDDVVVVDAGAGQSTNNNNITDKNKILGGDETMDTTDDWQDVNTLQSASGSPSASGMLEEEDEDGHGGHHPTSASSNISFLGKVLAQEAVTAISSHNVRVKSPGAALAVAFHACLRSEMLGFACTGVPEEHIISINNINTQNQSKKKKKNSLAFAPPVRELPKTQFLPSNWESTKPNTSDYVSMRYRKNGTGALVLTVNVIVTGTTGSSTGDNSSPTVDIYFAPANSKEPSPVVLSFSLDEHFNMDSWEAAKKSTGGGSFYTSGLPPSLHYKSLATMLTKFCQTFDLGLVRDDANVSSEAGMVDCASGIGCGVSTSKKMKSDDPSGSIAGGPIHIMSPPTATPPTTTAQQAPPNLGKDGRVQFPSAKGEQKNNNPNDVDWKSGRMPSTLDQAFPNVNGGMAKPGGDFSGDLLPAGLQDPRFVSGRGHGGRMGGNMMGPNHPMFTGGGSSGMNGPPIGGPGSMQPRFDPFYPAGIDDGGNGDLPFGPGGGPPQPPGPKNNNNHLNRPSRRGEPNPDHLPPPNSLGGGGNDHMFM